MSVSEKIDKEQFRKAMEDRFVKDKAYMADKAVCLSPGVQAQKVPDEQRGACDMPILHEINGIYQAWEFRGWKEECRSITTTCYIGDWTYLAKLHVKGPGWQEFLKGNFINKFDTFPNSKEKHVFAVNENGKLVVEGIAFKLADDELLLTGGLTMSPEHVKADGYDVEVRDVTAEEYCYHVQGPNSRATLEAACGEDLSDIRFTRFRTAQLNGHEVRVFRGGMSGELGYEVHGDSAYGSADWEAIVEAGKEFGIEQYGYRAMPFNHLEAYFPTQWVDYIPATFPGDDFANDALFRSPVDYHWDDRIDFNRDFVGKQALLSELENPKYVGVMLEWNSEDMMKIYASLFDDEPDSIDLPNMPVARTFTYDDFFLPVLSPDCTRMIGYATNRGYSVRTKRFVSITMVATEFAEPGTEVMVKYGREGKRQIMLRATVKAAPYKPDNRF